MVGDGVNDDACIGNIGVAMGRTEIAKKPQILF
jgi:cation transport ATPase